MTMAATNPTSLIDIKIVDINGKQPSSSAIGIESKGDYFDYSKRAQWLRAAILGSMNGVVTAASLMIGSGTVKQDIKVTFLTWLTALVSGACTIAAVGYVSVYTQLDTVFAQMKRDKEREIAISAQEEERAKKNLPNPLQVAVVSTVAHSIGSMVPLVAAIFIREYKVRLGVLFGAVTMALLVFGWLAALLGKAPVARSASRVLVGGWIVMAITFVQIKLIG